MNDIVKQFQTFRRGEFLTFLEKERKGADGATGTQGLPGVQGPQGPQGKTGPAGPRGDEGPPGHTGQKGEQGARGHNGEDGLPGAQGEHGPMPKHESRGDSIRFEIAPGQWGRWIALSGQLDHGKQNLSVGSLNEAAVTALIEAHELAAQYNTSIETVGTFKYIGNSVPGTATSATGWRIKRVDLTTTDIPIFWANGSAAFDKVMDDFASYTYTATGL